MHKSLALIVVLSWSNLVCAPAPKPVASQRSPAPIVLWKTPSEMVRRFAHTVPASDEARYGLLKKYFNDQQCADEDLVEPAVPGPGRHNLICTLRGSTAGIIVIAAHYEMEGKGTAAVDDWSGAVMLPLLYRALVAAVPRHTFLFVELDGNAGARSFLASLPKDRRKNIQCMIALEALGLGPTEFLLTPNDGESMLKRELILAATLAEAANILHLTDFPSGVRPSKGLKVDDTQEFHRSGVPSLLVHSLRWQDRNLAGSPQDTADAIDDKSYNDSYNLLSTYCAHLDRTIDGKLAEQQIREQLTFRKPTLR